MKTKLNKNLTNIRNFLNLLRTENPTQEEIYNFLLELKTFVFNQYVLQEKNYDITIQFVHPKVLDFDEAQMDIDKSYGNKFTIYLSKEKLSGKNNLVKTKRTKENKKAEQTTENYKQQHNNRVSSVLTITQSFLHELGHVIQYIRDPKRMKKEDDIKDTAYETLADISLLLNNSRKKRLILKALGKHINAMAYMAGSEKDANRKGYIYFANILSILLPAEQDEEMIDFLCLLYMNINRAKKHNFKIYRQYSKENREAIDKLHDLKLEKELDEITKKLINKNSNLIT